MKGLIIGSSATNPAARHMFIKKKHIGLHCSNGVVHHHAATGSCWSPAIVGLETPVASTDRLDQFSKEKWAVDFFL